MKKPIGSMPRRRQVPITDMSTDCAQAPSHVRLPPQPTPRLFGAATTTYKGLTVIEGTPSGAGGLYVNNNWKAIADRLEVNDCLVVAPSTASENQKRRAAYVCDADADEVEINQAITAAADTQKKAVLLLAGTYYVKSDSISIPPGVFLLGQGRASTTLALQSGHTLSSGSGILKLANASWDPGGGGVRDLAIVGNGTVWPAAS